MYTAYCLPGWFELHLFSKDGSARTASMTSSPVGVSSSRPGGEAAGGGGRGRYQAFSTAAAIVNEGCVDDFRH